MGINDKVIGIVSKLIFLGYEIERANNWAITFTDTRNDKMGFINTHTGVIYDIKTDQMRIRDHFIIIGLQCEEERSTGFKYDFAKEKAIIYVRDLEDAVECDSNICYITRDKSMVAMGDERHRGEFLVNHTGNILNIKELTGYEDIDLNIRNENRLELNKEVYIIDSLSEKRILVVDGELNIIEKKEA